MDLPKVIEALIYLLDNINIRFDSKLHRQNVGITIGTNCDPLVTALVLVWYETDFMKTHTKGKQYNISNRKAMNRSWHNQKPNPALKTKTGNKSL